MAFDQDAMPMHLVVRLLEQVSATTGFSPAQIVSLVDCELDTNHLLDYITAVMSKHMN